MAYVNETHTGGTISRIVDRVSTYFHKLSAFNAQYRVYNKTLRELESLTDRDLADIGIGRSMIHDIARETAFGK